MRNVLITGANRGLGLALAREFSSRGHGLFLVVRRFDAATEMQIEFPDAKLLCCDITAQQYEQQLRQFLQGVTLNLLINNAGSGSSGSSVDSALCSQLQREFDTHCKGTLATVKAALVSLINSPQAMILNISSRRGSMTMQAQGAAKGAGCSFSYRIAKAAQNMLTLCIADDLEEQGVVVAAITPGRMLTAMAAADAQLTAAESAGRIAEWVSTKAINNRDYLCVETGKLPW